MTAYGLRTAYWAQAGPEIAISAAATALETKVRVFMESLLGLNG
jgi:hypothetical protein